MSAAATSMAAPISPQDVAKAQAHLRRMRSSLSSWLKYRAMNDQVVAGARATTKPRAIAMQVIQRQAAQRAVTERNLADQLHTLLSEVMPNTSLPDPAQPGAAVPLAQIAITGRVPSAMSSPEATGAAEAWLWPAIIVGGLLLAVTTAVRSMADVAATQEQYACVQAGGCTDYSLWLKAAGVVVLGWFLWTQTRLGRKGG